MKAIILAALTVLGLGVGGAYAQGLPPGAVPQHYGPSAAASR